MAATAQYLATPFTGRPDISTSEGLLLLFAARSQALVSRLAEQKLTDTGEQATGHGGDPSAPLAYRASEAHVAYVMLKNNLLAVDSYFSDPSTKRVMELLLRLWALQCISAHAGDWIGIFEKRDVVDVDREIDLLIRALRPDIVPLVDSFGFLDQQLKSTLGRKDGDVYTAIYREALENPLNTKPNGRMAGWDKLSQVLDLDFLDETSKAQHASSPCAAKL